VQHRFTEAQLRVRLFSVAGRPAHCHAPMQRATHNTQRTTHHQIDQIQVIGGKDAALPGAALPALTHISAANVRCSGITSLEYRFSLHTVSCSSCALNDLRSATNKSIHSTTHALESVLVPCGRAHKQATFSPLWIQTACGESL